MAAQGVGKVWRRIQHRTDPVHRSAQRLSYNGKQSRGNKRERHPPWIWDNKVVLDSGYSCSSVYNNKPMTLLSDDKSNRCLRDRYKVIYIEGFTSPIQRSKHSQHHQRHCHGEDQVAVWVAV